MSSRHPYNAVFPVVLVASTVFSILSLPFFLHRLQLAENTPSSPSEFQPILESQNRDVTIRYIGAAMVLSVITGISTIEFQKRRQSHQTLANSFASAQPTQLTRDSEPAFDESDLNPVLASEQSGLTADSPALVAEVEPLINYDLENAEDISTDYDSFQREELIAELDDLHQDYSTCRIWVHTLQRRLFAIQIEGQFYSFFRLLPSKEAARQTALQLSVSRHYTIITPVEQEFAVWVWQPEAELEGQAA